MNASYIREQNSHNAAKIQGDTIAEAIASTISDTDRDFKQASTAAAHNAAPIPNQAISDEYAISIASPDETIAANAD